MYFIISGTIMLFIGFFGTLDAMFFIKHSIYDGTPFLLRLFALAWYYLFIFFMPGMVLFVHGLKKTR